MKNLFLVNKKNLVEVGAKMIEKEEIVAIENLVMNVVVQIKNSSTKKVEECRTSNKNLIKITELWSLFFLYFDVE